MLGPSAISEIKKKKKKMLQLFKRLFSTPAAATHTHPRVPRMPFFFVAQEVAEGVTNIKGLSLVGEPTAMVVCFRGEGDVNIYKVVRFPHCL